MRQGTYRRHLVREAKHSGARGIAGRVSKWRIRDTIPSKDLVLHFEKYVQSAIYSDLPANPQTKTVIQTFKYGWQLGADSPIAMAISYP